MLGKDFSKPRKEILNITRYEVHFLTLKTKDVEIRKIAYKALCCDRSKVTSQLVSFQSQNLSLV